MSQYWTDEVIDAMLRQAFLEQVAALEAEAMKIELPNDPEVSERMLQNILKAIREEENGRQHSVL